MNVQRITAVERAQLAASILPALIATPREYSDEEMVARAVKLAGDVFDAVSAFYSEPSAPTALRSKGI